MATCSAPQRRRRPPGQSHVQSSRRPRRKNLTIFIYPFNKISASSTPGSFSGLWLLNMSPRPESRVVQAVRGLTIHRDTKRRGFGRRERQEARQRRLALVRRNVVICSSLLDIQGSVTIHSYISWSNTLRACGVQNTGQRVQNVDQIASYS
jgi:hypothetical protein